MNRMRGVSRDPWAATRILRHFFYDVEKLESLDEYIRELDVMVPVIVRNGRWV